MLSVRTMWITFVAVASLLGGSAGVARAEDGPTNQELLNKMKAMEERIQSLERQLEQRNAAAAAPPAEAPATTAASPPPQSLVQTAQPGYPPPVNKDLFGLFPSPIEGLRLGAYGELKFGTRQNPDHNGQWQTGFDAARLVLLPTFQFTDSIIFNAEIEFEHAGSGFDEDDKLHGTAEIEQLFVDFKISPYFNIRSPGVDLVPVGYINQHHEPTLFYSVNRPELADRLVPTTWAVPAASVYGKIVDDLSYQLQVSSSLEDFGSGFDARTDGNSPAPFPTGYAPGISGKDGLIFARPPRGDFRQLNNDLAYALRLSYTPSFIPGLAGSSSVYFTPNTTPRDAYADTGAPLHRSSLTMVDSELRYRMPGTGFEARGEYVQVFFGHPGNLRANNDSDPTNNVGRSMYGLSGEVAYHVPIGTYLGSAWEAVPFYRYTYEDLQTHGFSGTDLNTPTGAGKLQFHTAGVAVFPTPKLVLKLTYEKVLDRQRGGPKTDSVLGGLGFHF
ncbi:MAG TPA: hypothetical protein VJX92_28845 [Methylomirabilota bacterium]|nr:hypothetical protein [Methylomirabilota bacterium]